MPETNVCWGMERREVYYSGHVQGVGFRYTTRNIARGYDVTGQVRNLSDGRVHLVAEGSGDQLDQFLAEIDRALGQYIGGRQATTSGATNQFRDFQIG